MIYLDYNATTPLDPRVLEAMVPWFGEKFGNAASRPHRFGAEARDAVEAARAQAASLIGADPEEIVWTSGATESDNLALKGVAAAATERKHLVSVVTEHRAVLDPLDRLERSGCTVTVLGVGRDGLVDLDRLARAVTDRTLLVSVMHANNETGVLQPLDRIGKICRDRGALFHTDAGGTIALSAEPAGDGAVCLTVTDTGHGIPAEYLPHLFEKFFRVPGSPEGGSGLGLFIAKGVVQAHGGEIGIDSTPGHGATFWFTVPVAPPAAGV